ncbi:hypothetical protein PCASD_25074 [Puccinia coronata f. sp. avenae]|uniref:Uncharacterized protein n=1 Tax=Puccinia coronata f. sp. avenae TaxID=200324 RepID=A0A2N5TM10_9BASI|nr:hypothetical protein PCASD_25074 [Puccinia coronata f. sp. avenae]
MPHAVRTPTNGVRTAGSACGPARQACWPCTPVRPGSRKPLKSRGLRYLGTLIRVPFGALIRVPGYPYKGTVWYPYKGTERYPYKGTVWYPYKGTERYPYKGTQVPL